MYRVGKSKIRSRDGVEKMMCFAWALPCLDTMTYNNQYTPSCTSEVKIL